MENKQFKVVPFTLQETKEVEREGQQYGTFSGFGATYNNIDRGGDRILKGAFTKSLARHRESGRPIRMFWQHNGMEVIGGYPIDEVRDTDEGLYVKGEINLSTQRGREAYALMKQGVISDLSIGYLIMDADYKSDVRELKELDLMEISPVAEPMNTQANIMSVKAVSGVDTLPLAPVDHHWNANTATMRVRKFTGSTEKPSASYKRAFMYYETGKEEEFTAYKLPYADVIGGKLMAVPRAIFAIAATLHGGRGGVDIPDSDKKKITTILNSYYDKLDMESPLRGQKTLGLAVSQITLEDVFEIKTQRNLEHFLRDVGCSHKAASCIASRFKPAQKRDSLAQDVDKKQAVKDDLSVLGKDDLHQLSIELERLTQSFK